MSLKLKIILLSIIPLVVVTGIINAFVFYQSTRLSEHEIAIIEENVISSKRQELQKYIELALRSIKEIYENAGPDDEVAKKRVKDILNNLTFGDDGYFFVYTWDGKTLVLPYQKELVGKNQWEVTDVQGKKLLQALIKQGRNGGGFVTYYWHKPSKKEKVKKLSYAVSLDKWGWMMGTGLYIEDVDAEVAKIRKQVSKSIKDTFSVILLVTTISVALIATLGASLNISERKLADKKLKALTRRIIESQEEERARVSRELHDGINQLLVAIKYRLEAAEELVAPESEAKQSIELGTKTINQAIQEIRRISKDLRPSVLDDLGLTPALDSLLAEYAQLTRIQVNFNNQLGDLSLPRDAQTTLYRVTQESLHNIEKHAKATEIEVHLSHMGDKLKMEIKDNGAGFDVKNVSLRHSGGGLGLRNMRERIEHLEGQFELTSVVGNGTQIVIWLPLNSK